MLRRYDEVMPSGTPQVGKTLVALSVYVFFVRCVSGKTCG